MDSVVARRAAIVATCAMGIAAIGTARADSRSLTVPLSSAQCVPPVDSASTGAADFTYDPTTRVLGWSIKYKGLSSPATMAHIHGPASPGKNAPVVLWLSKRGSPPGDDIVGQATLSEAQAQQFAAGGWYVNIHTQSHPACELRGQVTLPRS